MIDQEWPVHAEATAVLLRALGEPTRLRILGHLLGEPHNVRQLTEHLDLAQSTVSQHLAVLRDSGLVESETRGRSSFYSVANDERVRELLGAADELACPEEAHGDLAAVGSGRGAH